MGLSHLRTKNMVGFSLYPDAVAAAVAGQGVVIGRLPLLAGLLADGRLVAPFGEGGLSRRSYFIETARRASSNADALDFVRWLHAEADEMRLNGVAAQNMRQPAVAQHRMIDEAVLGK